MLTFIARSQAGGIDGKLKEQCVQEEAYWREVLKRVVSVITFLAERGLSFRGDNQIIGSSRNGNFLGILELLSQFDPFLAEHMRKYGNMRKGTTSYLSTTVCEELITVVGQRVLSEIILPVQKEKYFSFV